MNYARQYKEPEPSKIESLFWEEARRIIPELEKEFWIGKYRVDFYIPSKKVIIELYGFEYHNSKLKLTIDAEREKELQKLGYQIIRFTGTEIFKNVHKCIKDILEITQIEPVLNENITWVNEDAILKNISTYKSSSVEPVSNENITSVNEGAILKNTSTNKSSNWNYQNNSYTEKAIKQQKVKKIILYCILVVIVLGVGFTIFTKMFYPESLFFEQMEEKVKVFSFLILFFLGALLGPAPKKRRKKRNKY